MAEDDRLSDEDIRAAARHWLAQDHWKDQISRSLDGRAPGDLRREHHDIPRQLLELDTDEQSGVTPQWARRHEAAAALETAGYPEQSDMTVLDRTADVMIDIIREQVEKRMQEVFRPEVIAAAQAPARNSATPTVGSVLAEKTPVISENVERWLIDIQKPSEGGQKGIPEHHARQKRVSVRLLTEIVGDRPAGSVSREDAAAFRLQLLRLPASHGKGRHVHALEAIAKAAGTTQKKFQMKTVKRHFSAIKGYCLPSRVIGSGFEIISLSLTLLSHSRGTNSRAQNQENQTETIGQSRIWSDCSNRRTTAPAHSIAHSIGSL